MFNTQSNIPQSFITTITPQDASAPKDKLVMFRDQLLTGENACVTVTTMLKVRGTVGTGDVRLELVQRIERTPDNFLKGILEVRKRYIETKELFPLPEEKGNLEVRKRYIETKELFPLPEEK